MVSFDERSLGIKVRARSDYYFFSRYMFRCRRGYNWQRARHHKIICDALTNVYLGKTKRLILNLPPRFSKTELGVVNFISWCLGKNPDSEFIHASYSSTLASNNSWQTRELVTHEAYRDLFPAVKLREDSAAKHEWRTTAGGIVYATGSGGTITGYGAGKHREGFGGAIIIDDPHKANEATSDTIRNGVIDWFQNTLESRKNDPQNTPIILIMQRLHEDDLAGWLLKGGNGEKWDHVCLPAINEDGSALWPEKHTIEQLRQMEKANSYVFAGQYMQRPSPLGGGLIKGAWLVRHKVLPKLRYFKIFADTALKTGERNDYSVFACWGLGEDGRIYLIDLIRGKWEAGELERRAIAFWEKHKALNSERFAPPLRQMVVEDAASGTGLIQRIKERGGIPIKGLPRTKDKLTRLMDVVGYIESGLVSIPEAAPFTNDFVNECEAFTPDDTHAHDDIVDTCIDAINDLLVTKKSIYDNL